MQAKGTASPSIIATLVERFPHEDDPRRPMEEKNAKDVAATAYIGLWRRKYTLNGRRTDSFIILLSLAGGVDTVGTIINALEW